MYAVFVDGTRNSIPGNVFHTGVLGSEHVVLSRGTNTGEFANFSRLVKIC